MKIPIYVLNFDTDINNVSKTIESLNIIKSFEPEIKTIGKQTIDYNAVIRNNVNFDNYRKIFILDKHQQRALKCAYTIQYILDNESSNFFIIDEHAVLTKDIDFIDDESFTIGQIQDFKQKMKTSILPVFQYFNVNLIKSAGIKYFDKERILFGNSIENSLLYDAGASFYEDLNKNELKISNINVKNYVDFSLNDIINLKTIYKHNYERH